MMLICACPYLLTRATHGHALRATQTESQLGTKAASEPSSPIVNVDLTASTSQAGEEEKQEAAASSKGGPPSLLRRSVRVVHGEQSHVLIHPSSTAHLFFFYQGLALGRAGRLRFLPPYRRRRHHHGH